MLSYSPLTLFYSHVLYFNQSSTHYVTLVSCILIQARYFIVVSYTSEVQPTLWFRVMILVQVPACYLINVFCIFLQWTRAAEAEAKAQAQRQSRQNSEDHVVPDEGPELSTDDEDEEEEEQDEDEEGEEEEDDSENRDEDHSGNETEEHETYAEEEDEEEDEDDSEDELP